MSLESTIIAISLLLGIVLLILIIYLISRVNDLEARAFSNAMPSDTANSVEPARQKVFAGLVGENFGMNGWPWPMAQKISIRSRAIKNDF